ncbi:membrane protease subunit [Pseudomonas xionganensis]|uniref:Membrane protease subunit n=1 Tax=Pseudomonas xionganensis TaxID=2654845 RepID=A0A6I4KX66_9PSED|nr:membrane protease subunit [Pseudomonas xionganensis]MVW75362.1 membrane protease subunit [Pseudomonas xionganensis]
MHKKQKGEAAVITLVIVMILVMVGGLFFGLPLWNRWRAGIGGEAELRQAEFNRQIATLEAKQELESAEYLNQAEVLRARGVAEANRIVADGLGGPDGYLRYLWIQGLSKGSTPQVIYIPTEAGLPVLEAGKR